MKFRILALIILVSTSLTTQAQNITEQNSEKAQAIINAVLEAYGGRDTLANLQTVAIESTVSGSAVGQSRRPGPPWDTRNSTSFSAIDLQNRRLAGRNTDAAEDYQFDQGQFIDGDSAFQIDYRTGTATPVPEPDFNQQSGPFIRITAALLVHQLTQRSHTTTFLGETNYNDRPHDVLSMVMEVGPSISLYIDKATKLLSRSERIFPQFGLVEYEFRDYRPVNGVLFNHSYTFYVQGQENDKRNHKNITVNESIDQYMRLPKGINKLKPREPDEMSAQEVASGVYLIGGQNVYGLFIEMDDHVIAVGGTGSSDERLEMLRERVADKPLKYAVFTHHHSDHVLAAPSYASAGATLISHESHKAVVRTAAGEVDNLKLETVTSSRTLSDGEREVKIFNMGPTSHTEDILAVYLPKERILFTADHFQAPAGRVVVPANNSSRDMAAAIERERLNPKAMYSAHSPKAATMKQLRKALATKPNPNFRNTL